MRIKIAQICVDADPARNKDKILQIVGSSAQGECVAFPEGALTGYFPERADYLKDISPDTVAGSLEEIAQAARRAHCHCVLGTALFADGAWRNAVVICSASGAQHVYCKIELSGLDQAHFGAGTEVRPYSIDGVKLGVQVCCELIFPAAWKSLKRQGAQLVFHINNALKPEDALWDDILVARAVENRYFVCSVNNGAPPQQLASYLVAPSGKILLKTAVPAEQICAHEIDVNEATVVARND